MPVVFLVGWFFAVLTALEYVAPLLTGPTPVVPLDIDPPLLGDVFDAVTLALILALLAALFFAAAVAAPDVLV